MYKRLDFKKNICYNDRKKRKELTIMKITANKKGFSVLLNNEEFFRFTPTVKADSKDKADENEEITAFIQNENSYIWEAKSDVYKKKIYTLIFNGENAVFRTKLIGSACIGKVKWFLGSDFDASHYYSPNMMANGQLNPYRFMTESSTEKSNFFVPPPLCYVFDMQENEKLLGVGLCAKEKKYNFDYFTYEHENNLCCFGTNYNHYTEFEDEYDLPDILFTEDTDRFEIYKKYSLFHFENGYTNKIKHKKVQWWNGPFFCGWGDQWFTAMDMNSASKKDSKTGWDDVAIAENAENDIPLIFDMAINCANEKIYRELLDLTKQKNIPYNTIIIDCKWNTHFGTMEVDKKKWPDLRKFIDEQHKNGIKVLLWFNFWSTEGLEADECITVEGKPVYVDPTNKKYQTHIKEILYKLLSSDEGCYDADGFKIDFMNIPDKENMVIAEKGIYGIELLKMRLQQIFDISHSIKEDTLICAQCVHPYFDECQDMMRIGDYWSSSNHSSSHLEKRIGVLKAVLPDVLVDTDSAGGRNRDSLIYYRKSVKMGVPCFYGTKMHKKYTEKEWKEVSSLYYEYIEKTYK